MSTSASRIDPRQSPAALRPLLVVLAILAGTFALDRIAAFALQQLVASSDHRLSRIYGHSASADVLIVGSSVANAMVVPPELARATGLSVFSIASHGIDARTQNAFALDLIDRKQAPKIAILEPRPIFSPILQAPAFSTFQGLSSRLASLEDEASHRSIRWRKVFRIYSFNSPMLMTVLQKVVDRDDQATGPSNGHINNAMKARWRALYRPPIIYPAQLPAFLETIEALRGAGTKVIIVAAPLHPVTRSLPWMRDITEQIRRAVPPDVVVVDYSALLDDDEFFEDPVHLNAAGRRAFEPYLERVLERTGG